MVPQCICSVGWIHDRRALDVGRGIFFRFPCTWVSSVELPTSIREFSVNDQTQLARHAITTGCSKKGATPKQVTLSDCGKEYTLGGIKRFKAGSKISINISTAGVILAPLGFDGGLDSSEVMSWTPMRLITLCAGGENQYYNVITFIGKDPNTKRREAFVLDCGEKYVDEVLQTLGQAFNLAIAKRKKPSERIPLQPRRSSSSSVARQSSSSSIARQSSSSSIASVISDGKPAKAPQLPDRMEKIIDAVPEECKIPEEMQEVLQEVVAASEAEPVASDGGESASIEVDLPESAIEMTKTENGEEDDISTELISLMKSEVKCVYQTSDEIVKPDVQQMSKLVGVFNRVKSAAERWKEQVALKKAAAEEVERPTWVYFKPAESKMTAAEKVSTMKKLQQSLLLNEE